MTDRFHFEGIYVPVITPFHADGRPNWDALADITAYLIESGVQGLISGGSTGEYYAQTVEERIEIGRFTQERIKGQAAFVMGSGAMRTPDAIALAEAARDMKADAILLASPPYALPTDAENAENALAIDRAADLPIMLYNYPHRTGTMMGTAFLDRVSQSANFCGIKESSGDINRVHLLANAYPSIQLGCGMDDQALEFFAWGARFWVCGGANFLPKEHLALYETCAVEGDFDKGRRIMSALLPLMDVLEQGGKFVQTIKYGATLNGIAAGPARPPLQGLDAEEEAALKEVMQSIQTAVAAIRDAG